MLSFSATKKRTFPLFLLFLMPNPRAGGGIFVSFVQGHFLGPIFGAAAIISILGEQQ
jgi:hypothetical protein